MSARGGSSSISESWGVQRIREGGSVGGGRVRVVWHRGRGRWRFEGRSKREVQPRLKGPTTVRRLFGAKRPVNFP